jgi:hypothetical protein
MSEAFEATYKTYPSIYVTNLLLSLPTSLTKRRMEWLDNTKPKTHLWLLCFENLKVW